MEKWHWLGALWCLQPHHELYFRRDIARGDKHSSENGKGKDLGYFVYTKLHVAKGENLNIKNESGGSQCFVLNIPVKLLIVLTMPELLNSTQEEPSSTMCRIYSFRGSLGSLDCCSSFLGFSYRALNNSLRVSCSCQWVFSSQILNGLV